MPASRHRRHLSTHRLLLAAAALGLPLGAQSQADYGDAPTSFPVTAAQGGPRHLDVTKEWLGRSTTSTTTLESAPLTVNLDADDGQAGMIPMQFPFGAMNLFSVEVSVNTAVPGARYLNLLVDLNSNGAWDGGAEWAARNVEVPVNELPAGVGSVRMVVTLDPSRPIASYTGKWCRATVSVVPLASSSGAFGLLSRGETEDFVSGAGTVDGKLHVLQTLAGAWFPARPCIRHGTLHALDGPDPDGWVGLDFPVLPPGVTLSLKWARVSDVPGNPYFGSLGNAAGMPAGGVPLPIPYFIWSPWWVTTYGLLPANDWIPVNGAFPFPALDGDTDATVRARLTYDPVNTWVHFTMENGVPTLPGAPDSPEIPARFTVCGAHYPLATTWSSNNSGAVGGALYFDLVVNVPQVEIYQLDLNCLGSGGVAATVDVLTAPGGRANNQLNANAWNGPSSPGNPFTTAPVGSHSICTLATPLVLPYGTHGVTLRAHDFAHAYTNGANTYATAELTLDSGEASNVPFTGPLFQPRTPNLEIQYTTYVGAGLATATNYGAGCGARAASFYEPFATSAAFDLAYTAISMLPNGADYVVVPGITGYVAPSATAMVLPLTDDSETAVTLGAPFPHATGATNSLTVCSNGHVSIATGNGVGFTPASATMLGAPQTGWWNWHDYNPSTAGGGQIKFEQVGSIAYVTWDGVWDFGGASAANANTFQFQFDTASGAVHMVFQTMSPLGNNRLVGYSPGGPSPDPGSRDLSLAVPQTFALPEIEMLPLTLTSVTRPILGQPVALRTSEMPPGTLMNLLLLGLTRYQPGIDLTALGMPGCTLLQDAVVMHPVLFPGSPDTTLYLLPATPAALGLHLFVQAAAYSPTAGLTTLGFVTSNGVDLRLGDS